jgi:SAM-dependent methyltransferase
MNQKTHALPFKGFFNSFLYTHRQRFTGRTVVDLPAGSGETSKVLHELGAVVVSFDLFPEYFKAEGLLCTRLNLMEGIPLPDSTVDVIICQEGMEHFSDQLFAFREFNRILKTGGLLIITTPNYSNLRAKLSYLLSESERFGSIMPPNELDSVWMSNSALSSEIYCGHIFLLGIQKLRVLARLSGFTISKINSESIKSTSVLLFPFLYPFILLSNFFTYRKNLRKKNHIPLEMKKKVFGEVFRLSIHPRPLVDGTLFVEFIKEMTVAEAASQLRSIHQSFDVPT